MELNWNRLLKLWSSTDALVAKLIAHTKRDPQEKFQMDGDTAKLIRSEWKYLAEQRHDCDKQECREDNAELLKIVEKNMKKIMPTPATQTEAPDSDSQSDIDRKMSEHWCKPEQNQPPDTPSNR